MEYRTREDVHLRDVTKEDLHPFFEQQLDSSANYMAAFTSKDPTDKVAFMKHWTTILENQSMIKKTIYCKGCVVGNIVKFKQFGKLGVSYWIGKEYWGKGIATYALLNFLEIVIDRPLYARAAKDNAASIRVLEKCGFKKVGEDIGFSNARSEDVEEFILKLEGQ
ncbi:GNAT family N-acetyltransferase [Virgibacillus byunsanensis]|uniref:GNAT family N-acetyltransferase n=1 Tax=Virgibacillus byunsanensis TaxID=570945 RepID=A0ABW3LLN6_9BACI